MAVKTALSIGTDGILFFPLGKFNSKKPKITPLQAEPTSCSLLPPGKALIPSPHPADNRKAGKALGTNFSDPEADMREYIFLNRKRLLRIYRRTLKDY